MLSTDNVFASMKLTLANLANIGKIADNSAIPPSLMPLLIGVEPVRDRQAPEGTPPAAWRYILAFPGSGFMRLPFKVDEAAPSVSPKQIEESGGFIRVNVEGYSFGTFEVEGGGVRAYFKASKITPFSPK